ncbi:radical SAM protein [Candidatus Woesearchaeota archaeon]|nr:radical SAM protein [Candidatus Woesearchaeota archaeon]MBT4630602.1 radical SAM protein [Candidatus Woesearchaeota archaeon]
MTHHIIKEKSEIPLVGAIAFGIIDRGTNLLQIRPTSVCNQKCPFCSTNANNSKIHPNTYEVEKDYLIKWVRNVIKEKECNEIEANIDSVGEILCHPKIMEIINEIKELPEVTFLSLQTNGLTLTKEKIDKIKNSVDRINLSIHTLDKKQAKELAGSDIYDIEKIKEIAKYAVKQGIEVLLAPVWLPKINDEQIPKLIDFAKEIKAKIGIQKYEVYKYSRKMKGAKATNYWKFYDKLKKLEKEKEIKLILKKEDMNIKKIKRIQTTLDIGETLNAEIKLPGWLPNQMIAATKDRCITVNDCNEKEETFLKIKITDNKNNIYLAKKA